MKIHVEIRAIAMREPVYYTIEETGGDVLEFRSCFAECDAERVTVLWVGKLNS
jgi:hypothetical protein